MLKYLDADLSRQVPCFHHSWRSRHDPYLFESDQVLCGRDPDQMLSFCRDLDPAAEIDHGYSPEDFTILMRRRSPRDAGAMEASDDRT